ncbi:hypothetical protein BJX61DRAFT_489883 [Aspergillus egyptiacus]|nr:hypothetical protein BJX61DRAFT_489883 [Aspergillus egyptiacus]
MAELPDRSASAAEVRSYITQTLLSRYNANREFAEHAACAWQIGRGAELHDASLTFFQQVFGTEVGFCLHRSVLDAREDAYKKSLLGNILILLQYVASIWLVWILRTSPWSYNAYTKQMLFHGVVMALYGGLRPKINYHLLVSGVAGASIAFLTIWLPYTRKCCWSV